MFSSSTQRSGFFRRGVTKASFISLGKTPDDKDRFTMEVIGIAKNISKFLKKGGENRVTGRKRLGGTFFNKREDISSTDTHSKREIGGIFLGTSVAEEQEVESRLVRMSVTFFRK